MTLAEQFHSFLQITEGTPAHFSTFELVFQVPWNNDE